MDSDKSASTVIRLSENRQAQTRLVDIITANSIEKRHIRSDINSNAASVLMLIIMRNIKSSVICFILLVNIREFPFPKNHTISLTNNNQLAIVNVKLI